MTNLVSVIILESPSHVKDSENISRKRRQRERSARHPGGSPPQAVSQKRRQPRTRLEARRTGRTRSRRRPLRAVGRWERARVQRLRAGSGHQRSPPPDAPPGPPPSRGIAYIAGEPGVTRTETSAFVRDRETARRARRPGCRETAREARSRSYPDARGRTPTRQVVPGCPRSYLGPPPRYDLAQEGTTARAHVRPREPTYDRASPRTTARAHVRPRDALGGSRTRLQPRVLRRTAHAPRKRPTAAGRVPDRDAHGSAEAVRFIGGPLARGPRGRHGRAPGASRRWLPSHGIPGPRDAEAGRPERRSPRRPHPGPGTRRREQVVMLPIDVGHRLPEARRRDAAPS